MTAACALTLGISMLLYLAASVFTHAGLLFQQRRWQARSRGLLLAGLTVHTAGMGLHLVFSGQPPAASLLVLVALVTLLLLAAALLAERLLQAPHVAAVAPPLAFLALLYALLMPLRFDDARHVLVRYPWLGLHVGLSLLGYAGFAVAFCGAVAYLAQHRALRRGRLNRYLPSLSAAARVTFRFAAGGFWLYTIGLAMGLVWLLGAPGAYLRPQDAKIWMTVPAWAVFAAYLYGRGPARRHGSRLKWLVVLGFLLCLANLLAVRHAFRTPPPPAPAASTVLTPAR